MTQACWTHHYTGIVTTTDVLNDFCQSYSINTRSCSLFLDRRQLPCNQVVRKVSGNHVPQCNTAASVLLASMRSVNEQFKLEPLTADA